MLLYVSCIILYQKEQIVKGYFKYSEIVLIFVILQGQKN